MTPTDVTVEPTEHATGERSHEQWVQGFVEGWRAPVGAREFAEHFRPLLADDVRLVQPQLPSLTGFRAFADSFVAPTFALIPDIHGEVERWAASGDTLYIELTLRGTVGGRPLSFRACDRISLRDGVAVERESYFDPTPLLLAVARAPRTWARFLQIQRARLSRRRGGSEADR